MENLLVKSRGPVPGGGGGPPAQLPWKSIGEVEELRDTPKTDVDSESQHLTSGSGRPFV
jgi:hypothetical protein